MVSRVRKDASRPATLADVARVAGVVPMTASRAINSSGYVSDDVRKRVLKAARHLGYRPNVLARQLKGHRLNAIGILLPDISNPFSTALVEGVNQILDEAGYTTFIATTSRSVEREKASLQAFVDHRVDGLIVATRGTKIGDAALKRLAQQNIPLVTIGRPVQLACVDSVTADHAQGAYDAVKHLLSLGHRRIGFIGISPDDSKTLRRYGGYVTALREAGIEPVMEYTVGPPGAPAFATQEDGYQGMFRLAALKTPPTAVFARNDFAAIGAMRAAHKLGLVVPRDMAIAGFDNIPLTTFTTPPLTTVAQPIAEQGVAAAQFLLDRIAGDRSIPRRATCLGCTLIVRESTDPHAATTPMEPSIPF
ncbi:MAG TPA: LacI family DNA-binding transcriptional regulator [Terracidiphilus sp.]|jgi:DNA-binding LacI/PurR family transcriptional regulator|nr:LacI family DNA-binding transcriptional regulator [Terracidiphilus sp.]